MIKFIGNIIAKNFVEKNINNHKNTNLGANLASNGMSIFSILINMWQYMLILGVVLLAFLVGLPIAVWFLTTSWVLVVLSVFVALILNIIFVFKLGKSVMNKVLEEVAKSVGLGDKALTQMGDLLKNDNFDLSNPENSKEISAAFDTMFEGMEGFMEDMNKK